MILRWFFIFLFAVFVLVNLLVFVRTVRVLQGMRKDSH